MGKGTRTHDVRGTIRGDVCVALTFGIQNATSVFDISERAGYPESEPHPNYTFMVDDALLAAAGRGWAFQFGPELAQALAERERFVGAWKASLAGDVKPSTPKKAWWRR